MIQLKLDINSENIIKKYWNCSDDIPINVKKYIENHCSNFILEDMDTYDLYCSLCLCKLDEMGVCQNCKKKYDIKCLKNVYKVNINNTKKEQLDITYLVFDTPDNEVILYVIRAYVYYNNPLSIFPTRTINFKIEKAYYILKDKCINLFSKKAYLYKDIDKKLKKENYVFSEDIDGYFGEYNYNKYLYTENLNELENTIYCYTRIWEAKDFLKNKGVSIANLVYIPLHFLGFEYLIKYKLYSLAFDNLHLIKEDNDTKKILNPKSEYLDFIKVNELNYWQFEALKLSKIKDMDLIHFMEDTVQVYEYLLKIKKIKILELYNYLKNNKNDVIDYYDYIRFSKMLGYDLDNKKVLYPENLKKAHAEIIEKKDIVFDKKYDKKINKLAKTLEKNIYEDKNYIIFPAASVKEMIDEGKEQNNCLRFYVEDYSNNKTHIYFMRKKSNLKKSFVTIEIKNKKLVQARLKNNEIPNDNIMKILNIWVKKLN